MQKILVATDYSENAANAMEFAISLANHFGSQLSLVSAISEPYSAAGSLVKVTEHIRDEAMKTMDKAAAEVSSKLMGKATVDKHTVDGDPGVAIPGIAKAKGYDLVVMGSKGSTAAKEMFTGSVANAVVKNSEVPVLIVPREVRFDGLKKALLAVDDRARTEQPAILRVLADSYGTSVVPYHDSSDEPARGIAEAVRTHGADLLVMTYHDKGFFGSLFNTSTVSKVVFDAEVALLVVR